MRADRELQGELRARSLADVEPHELREVHVVEMAEGFTTLTCAACQQQPGVTQIRRGVALCVACDNGRFYGGTR